MVLHQAPSLEKNLCSYLSCFDLLANMFKRSAYSTRFKDPPGNVRKMKKKKTKPWWKRNGYLILKTLMKFIFAKKKREIVEKELSLSNVGFMRQRCLNDEYTIYSFFLFSFSLSIFAFSFISSSLACRGVSRHKTNLVP